MDILERPLSEWRRIAQDSGDAELLNYLQQFRQYDDVFVLHPVERDTGEHVAVIRVAEVERC